MADFSDRKDALLAAILDGDAPSLTVCARAIVCAAGDATASFTAEEAIRLALEVNDDARAAESEMPDVVDWLAELHRAAMRVRNE